jgi:phosphoribosylanthranilate isomerase
VTPVGVFVDQPPEELRAVAAASGVRVLQLHGDEAPAQVAGLPLPVLKAIRVSGRASLDLLASYEVSGFLLDAPSSGFGGSGRTFDWELAGDAAERYRVILAGGLDPENVAAAIRAVRPYAVDVASGVESAPGVKDPARLARFIVRAKEAA